jgi:hypothetical protein
MDGIEFKVWQQRLTPRMPTGGTTALMMTMTTRWSVQHSSVFAGLFFSVLISHLRRATYDVWYLF